MKRPEFAYHDPEGLSCTIEHLADMFLNFGGCNPIFYNFRPNSSAVCNPLITYVMLTAIATGSIESFVPSSDYIGQKGLEVIVFGWLMSLKTLCYLMVSLAPTRIYCRPRKGLIRYMRGSRIVSLRNE